jgi:hypothetical protein
MTHPAGYIPGRIFFRSLHTREIVLHFVYFIGSLGKDNLLPRKDGYKNKAKRFAGLHHDLIM